MSGNEAIVRIDLQRAREAFPMVGHETWAGIKGELSRTAFWPPGVGGDMIRPNKAAETCGSVSVLEWLCHDELVETAVQPRP